MSTISVKVLQSSVISKLFCITAPERETVIAATIILEVEDGCDLEIQDPTTDAYQKIKQQFIISVSVELVRKKLILDRSKKFWCKEPN